jgi:hypothetical protein
MKTKTIDIYEYEDIIKPENGKLLESILERYSDINTDYDWYEFIIEDFTCELENVGFKDIDTVFNGFYSQGDGASFTAKSDDILKILNTLDVDDYHRIKDLIIEDSEINIVRSHYNWVHENSCFCEINLCIGCDFSRHSLVESLVDDIDCSISDALETYRLGMCHKLYSSLRDEYERLVSKDQILETIKHNNHCFNDNGEIEN